MDTRDIHKRLTDALGAKIRLGGQLPPRIELRNDKTWVKLTIRYFPEQGRVLLTLDSIAKPRKAFIGSMDVRGVESVEVDRNGRRVLFELEDGEALTIYADARFIRRVTIS